MVDDVPGGRRLVFLTNRQAKHCILRRRPPYYDPIWSPGLCLQEREHRQAARRLRPQQPKAGPEVPRPIRVASTIRAPLLPDKAPATPGTCQVSVMIPVTG